MRPRAMRRRRRRPGRVCAAAACIAFGGGAAEFTELATAETFVVSTGRDQGHGSLRAAARRADETRGRDRIVFARGLRPVRLRSDLVLKDAVTIDGGPRRQTLIADRGDRMRFPRIHADYDPEQGRLVLRRITTRSLGLGDFQSGYQIPIAIRDASFLSRRGQSAGSALVLSGEASIRDSTIRGWSGTGVVANELYGPPHDQGLKIAHTLIAGNRYGTRFYAVSGRLANVELRANGTGIDTTDSNLDIVESTISGSTRGGGIDATYDGPGYLPYGGGNVSVRRSTIAGNRAPFGGGISMSDGQLDILNSTISGNRATGSQGDRGHGRGGGIYSSYGRVEVTATTVTGNAAAEGGGVSIRGPQNRIVSSIVADNVAPNGSDCAQIEAARPLRPVSSGANVFGTAGCGEAARPTDILAGSPRLKPLARNGGPTATHAVRPGSPAVGHGRRLGLKRDQRGVERGKNPDSGSFELR